MLINLDNGCYGKSLFVQYDKDGDYYYVNGDNGIVTFSINETYVKDLILCDSFYVGKVYIGKPVAVNVEENVISLEEGYEIKLSNIEYFGRTY